MNKTNSLKLLNAFPQLYRGFNKPVTETPMGLRFECHDGWFQIVWDLSVAIEEEARKTGLNATNWPEVDEVREKYGTLSFGMQNGSDVMWDLAQAAEEKSGLVCEMCGAPGQTYNDTWINTSCVSCRPIL